MAGRKVLRAAAILGVAVLLGLVLAWAFARAA
jgi:hypothetical protein